MKSQLAFQHQTLHQPLVFQNAEGYELLVESFRRMLPHSKAMRRIQYSDLDLQLELLPMGLGELVMVVEGKNVLDPLGVREPGVDRPWAAKNVCRVGVYVEISEEGAAMQPVIVNTRGVCECCDLDGVREIVRVLARFPHGGVHER